MLDGWVMLLKTSVRWKNLKGPLATFQKDPLAQNGIVKLLKVLCFELDNKSFILLVTISMILHS